MQHISTTLSRMLEFPIARLQKQLGRRGYTVSYDPTESPSVLTVKKDGRESIHDVIVHRHWKEPNSYQWKSVLIPLNKVRHHIDERSVYYWVVSVDGSRGWIVSQDLLDTEWLRPITTKNGDEMFFFVPCDLARFVVIA